MNQLTRLLQTPAAALETFEHPPHEEHRDPDREVAGGFCVSFVDGGSFRIRPEADRQAAWHVTPEMLLVTVPGLVYSTRHDCAHPADRCVTVAYAEAAVEQLFALGGPSPHPSVRAGAWPLTNRHQYLRRQLDACVRGDEARLETLAGDLFVTLLPAAASARQPLFKPELLSWYVARVDRARELMDASYAEPLSLTRISRDVGMSPFHFARVFRELTGVPPHRYLTGVRLAQAAQRLRDGARVTDACLAVGFGSLSHFIAAFRRRYGASPSVWVRRGRRSAVTAR